MNDAIAERIAVALERLADQGDDARDRADEEAHVPDASLQRIAVAIETAAAIAAASTPR